MRREQLYTSVIFLTLSGICGTTNSNITLSYTCDYIDLMLVVDGSGSVGVNGFEKVRKWLIKTCSDIVEQLGPRVQIGVVEYSDKPSVIPFRLGECTTKKCMTKKLKQMPYISRTTATYAALNWTLEVEFPYSKRANISRKVLILITDGQAEDGDDLPEWHRKAVAKNITSIAVGIGDYDLAQLQIVANGGKNNESVYVQKDYSSFPLIISNIIEKYCEDINECDAGTHNCSENTECKNSDGGYNCTCKDGFTSETNNHNCEDVDECSDHRICETMHYCKNLDGGYLCGCWKGYYKDGDTCKDIDECANPGTCKKMHFCENLEGGYRCGCWDGYLNEGNICSECSCTWKDGYEKPNVDCTQGNYSCAYKNKHTEIVSTCSVPQGGAFDAVFNSISEWQKYAENMTTDKQVIDKVLEINSGIQCVAMATRGSGSTSQSVADIEAAALDVVLSNPQKFPIKTFSSAALHSLSVDGMSNGKVIGIQFKAPKPCVDLLLPEKVLQNEKSLVRNRFIYSGENPIISLSVFEGEELEYREDAHVTFDIDVGKDFANATQVDRIGQDLITKTEYTSDISYKCMYINTTTSRVSEQGCTMVTYDLGSKVMCKCNHTTMFAVLLVVTEIQIPEPVKIVSYITEALSSLCLLLATVILLSVRSQIRGDRIGVQICLSISLLCLHVFNLLHDAALKTEVTCEIVAVLIHYFLLTSAMWMLMEGVTLVAKTNSHVLQILSEGNQKRFSVARHIISWGIPFTIVLVAALWGFLTDNYMKLNPLYRERTARSGIWDLENVQKYNYCWLEPNTLIWALVVPIGVIILFNCVIIIRMGIFVYKMSKNAKTYKPTQRMCYDDTSHIKATFKAILVLLPVLGISWILAFLTNVDARNSSYVFLYINAILNGIQGLFLLIVYCVVGKEVRLAVSIKYKRIEHQRHGVGGESSKKSINSKQICNKPPDSTKKTMDSGSISKAKSEGLAPPKTVLTRYSPVLSSKF